MYLLDADVFIEGSKREYGFDFCPAFWRWIEDANSAGLVYSIGKVKTELHGHRDDLARWASQHPKLFLEPTEAVAASMTALAAWATSRTPAFDPGAIATFLDDEADSFLVAHGHALGAIIVTREVPRNTPRKIKIPDAAKGMGMTCISPWEMLREQGVRFVLDDS